MGNLSTLITDGTHKTPTYTEKGIPFLSVQNISSGIFSFERLKYISEHEHLQLKKRVLPEKDDILFCRIGTLGKAIKNTIEYEYSIFVSLGLIRLIDNSLVDFIIEVINSPVGERWIDKIKVGGGTHTFKINLRDVPSLLVPLPPKEEQLRIFSFMNETYTPLITRYENSYSKLEKLNKEFPQKLRRSILQYAMQGKLVPQDPNDEPVEVLLEKIREEKKKLYKEGKIKKKDLEESIIYKGDDNSYYEKIGNNSETIEVPFDLPDSWRWSKFSNISNLYTGNSISKSIKESKYTNLKKGYPYIATKDIISSNIIDYDNGVRIPFNKQNFRISTPNSILLCIEGGSAGKKMAINKQIVCFGNKLCNFSTYGIDHKWLFAYIQSPEFSSNFGTNISGIIGGVGISKLKDMLVPIAPSNEINNIIQLTDLLFERLSLLD